MKKFKPHLIHDHCFQAKLVMQKSKKENRDGQEFIGTPTWKPAGKGVMVGQHDVHGRFGVVSANAMESVKLALTHAFMLDHKEGKALMSGTDAHWTSGTLPDLKSQAERRMLMQVMQARWIPCAIFF